MLEKEIRGEITITTFLKMKKEFTKRFGDPGHYKRLALLMIDRNHPEVDTRVRITNGKAEIMQKVKINPTQKNSPREEISIPIRSDPEETYNTYLILKNLHTTRDQQQMVYISAETENFVWLTKEYEIKLSNLSGKFDFYNYELEAIDSSTDLEKVRIKLGLEDELDISGEESKKRRRDLAIQLTGISKSEFMALLRKYL